MYNYLNKGKLRKIKGNVGENRATTFLLKNGYSIVERNFRIRYGEIDIIASKNDILVFFEVKTMPNGSPELLSHVLNLKKRQKIIITAKNFLLKNEKYKNHYIRFDVIVIDMPNFPEIYHIENAFSA